MKFIKMSLMAACLMHAGSACFAAETVIYTYDAKGRLAKIEHAGTVNNGIATQVLHDAADNRRNVKTTGAAR